MHHLICRVISDDNDCEPRVRVAAPVLSALLRLLPLSVGEIDISLNLWGMDFSLPCYPWFRVAQPLSSVCSGGVHSFSTGSCQIC